MGLTTFELSGILQVRRGRLFGIGNEIESEDFDEEN